MESLSQTLEKNIGAAQRTTRSATTTDANTLSNGPTIQEAAEQALPLILENLSVKQDISILKHLCKIPEEMTMAILHLVAYS
jgi:hypothetical protein